MRIDLDAGEGGGVYIYTVKTPNLFFLDTRQFEYVVMVFY